MGRSSLTARIHPSLDGKIKQQQRKAKEFFGTNITYIQASEILASKIRL